MTAARVLHRGLAGCAAGDTVALAPDAAHHLARVTRVREGDAVVLFDGAGLEAPAAIARVSARGGRAEVSAVLAGAVRPGVGEDSAGVWWLQGYPKGDKLEAVARQATELGVRALWPVYTLRSVPRPGDVAARVARLRAVAEAASAQCGRARVPEVREPAALDAALAAMPDDVTLRLVPWEGGGVPLRAALEGAAPSPGGCAVLVGPEGGLTADEVARAAARGFRAVTLGPRVLRTETVAPALLAAISYARGDLSR